MINLVNLSKNNPIWISDEEFELFVKKNDQGWTNCATQIEWLSKLYYLRKGFKEGKMKKEDFFRKEKELVLKWWSRWS